MLYKLGQIALNSLSPLGTKRSTVYQKMLISISLTYSRRIRFWIYDIGPSGNDLNMRDNDSNAIARYAAFKKCWLEQDLDCRVFENIDVEEMRYVVNTLLPDNEIEWLLEYNNAHNGARGPYSYMVYRKAYEFWSGVPHLYDPANKDYYYKKYNLDGYGIEYKKYYVHAWMMFETGGECWNLSNMGANMISVWGHPCMPLVQTGYCDHLAYSDYNLNEKGEGRWGLANNVFGWQNTNFQTFNYLGDAGGWYTQRPLNNWGSSYASHFNGTYIFLAQAALNDFENYEKAKELTLLAEVYPDDLAKQEQIYRKALKTQKINLDAWLGLVNNYIKQGKTAGEFLDLAREAGEALKYYPLPMHDILRLIGNYATGAGDKAVLTMIENEKLNIALKATENDINKEGKLCSLEVVIDWLEESKAPNNLPLIIGVSVGVVVLAAAAVVAAVVIIKKRKM